MSEVDDLSGRVGQHVSQALEYAQVTQTSSTRHQPAPQKSHQSFTSNKLVFWLEVLNLLGATREAVGAPETAAKLLSELRTLEDSIRFVARFFEVADTSTLYIYHSVLRLSP